MIGLGTLIDITLILLGGFAGLAFGRFINGRIQETLLKATAVAIIFIGMADPWYTGDFDATYRDVATGCSALFEHITGTPAPALPGAHTR